MYIIRDDTGKYLTQYFSISCNFQHGEEQAIRFDSLKRASKVLQNISKLVPEYIKLEIIFCKN